MPCGCKGASTFEQSPAGRAVTPRSSRLLYTLVQQMLEKCCAIAKSASIACWVCVRSYQKMSVYRVGSAPFASAPHGVLPDSPACRLRLRCPDRFPWSLPPLLQGCLLRAELFFCSTCPSRLVHCPLERRGRTGARRLRPGNANFLDVAGGAASLQIQETLEPRAFSL